MTKSVTQIVKSMARLFESVFVTQAYFVFRVVISAIVMGVFGFQLSSTILHTVNQRLMGVFLIPLAIIGLWGIIKEVRWMNLAFMLGFLGYNVFLFSRFLFANAYHFVGFYLFAFDSITAFLLIVRSQIGVVRRDGTV